MQIDWPTFIAQIINFFLLVYLLKRFLYKPIIDSMDAREAAIAANIEDAEKAKTEADLAKVNFEKQSRELETKKQEFMAQAEQEAEGKKKELFHQARAEVRDQQNRWREALRQEKESFLKEMRQRSSQQLWSLARRVLSDLASADLERQIGEVFVRKLGALSGDERNGILEALSSGGNSAEVMSSFELANDVRSRITSAIHAHIEVSLPVNYVTNEDVIAGVELKVGGQKVAWSVGDYLKELEAKLTDAVEDEVARVGLSEPTRKEAAENEAEGVAS